MSANKGYTTEQLRMITKVARLYHQSGLKQPEIAQLLDVSQASVSRALRDAERLGIVHISVHVPKGIYTELEIELARVYGLNEAVVVEPAGPEEKELLLALGDGAAGYLESIAPKCDNIGISSWSETLSYAVNAMRPIAKSKTQRIVQVLGCISASLSNSMATRITDRLARVCDAEPVYLLVPGICSDRESKKAMMREESCKYVFDFFNRLELLLVGIGTLEPSRYLSESGNRMTATEQTELKELGAQGDILQRFVNEKGEPVHSSFEERVVGMSLPDALKIPRRVGVAGGLRKLDAIKSILRGGYLTGLVTDVEVAKKLIGMEKQ